MLYPYPPMASLDLEALLKSAAEARWTDVVRRCAWCGRVADRHGRYQKIALVDANAVYTDGMCPPCGTRGLAQVRRRRPVKLLPTTRRALAA